MRILVLMGIITFSLLSISYTKEGMTLSKPSIVPTTPPTAAPTTSAEIVQTALDILSVSTTTQRTVIEYPFETEERTHWNFVPMVGKRKGLALEDMTPDQRQTIHNLLQVSLSATGYLKVTSIQQLERLLGEIENRLSYRNPGAYYLTIFGEPSLTGVWGWRFEGHHLSLNFSMVDGQVNATPTFMGANPGQVRETIFAGLEIFQSEIRIARELMLSFGEAQTQKALISTTAPHEIITGNARTAILEHYEGIPFTEMNTNQQGLLVQLLHYFVDNLDEEIAALQRQRIENAGIENMYFSWAGSTDPNEPHYFRIHGPITLIEYDNTQNNANHVHTVFRDLENDFGRDYLHDHYENNEHEH